MLAMNAREFPEEHINSGKSLNDIVRSKGKIVCMQRVDKIVEVLAWKMECDRIEEELEWRKARKTGIG